MKPVDDHSHSALCLSGCGVTVWPAEPKGLTAKLLKKRFTAPHLDQAGDTGLLPAPTPPHPTPVFMSHHFILLNTLCENCTFSGHWLAGLLGSNYQLKWHKPDSHVSQVVGLTEVPEFVCFSIWGTLKQGLVASDSSFSIFVLQDWGEGCRRIKIRRTM